MSGPGLEAAHGVNAARTRRRTLSARGNDGMRDGFLLLPRPGPCQRHDSFPIPARAGTHAVAWAGCTPLRLNRIRSVGLRDQRLRVRILSGAFRGRRPVAGRPVRNGKVAGSNPAGSTTCGMPPRVSADIPGNDVMSRRRAPVMEYARRRGRPARPPATRMWCSGSTPASQAGDRGFEPRHPLYPENQDNGSDPTMGLAAVLSMWTFPEKTWTNSPGMGTQRQGIRKHAIAPLVQRSEYRTFNPFVVVGSNPTGGTMHGKSPSISASIYYQIGCGSFFLRPRAKQGKETHSATDRGRAYNPDPITVRRTAPLWLKR